MKKFLSLFLVISCLLAFTGCGDGDKNVPEKSSSAGFGGIFSSKKTAEEFCDTVTATQELLDVVGDTYYSYWHDCIYDDAYGGDIDWALFLAETLNEENIATIKSNTEKIESLYKDCNSGSLEHEVKEVMHAYNAYYSFVIEISGSFKSYSNGLEECKKDLANALKNLSCELE